MDSIPRSALYILAGALYFLSPIDLIPDILPPMISRLDDIFVIGYLFWHYNRWKKTKTFVEHEKQSKTEFSGEKKNNSEHRKTSRTSFHPYEVLELESGAPSEEVEAAYRRLARQYHPDKVDHLGQEFQELAHEKMIEIQKAYELLRES